MINELHIQSKNPLECIQNTRISGDAIFRGNGIDDYDVKIEWNTVDDKLSQGGYSVLDSAKITICLIKG